jgi:hypothetical protein
MDFLIGVTYWPRGKAMGWWQAFDRVEVAEELAQIAAMGCHVVRVPLLWSMVQPSADRLDHRTLDHLGEVLDGAAAVGLRAVVDLQVGLAAGAFAWPDWALDLLPAVPPVRQIVNGRWEDRYCLRDPFADDRLVAAQRRLFREVIGYYAGHPAAFGWGLGHELDRACPPQSPDIAAEWLERRVAEIREVAGEVRLFWHSDLDACARPVGLRPHHIAAALGTLSIEAHPGLLSIAHHPLDSEVVRFAVALARAMVAESAPAIPVWAGCGVPTVPVAGDPGIMLADGVDSETRNFYFASEGEQAEFVENVLEGLIADGAAGCWLGHYADFDRPLWESPPLNGCRRARMLGLVHRDGSEKPAAGVVRRIRQRLEGGKLAPGRPERRLEVDLKEYWRDPERHMRRLYG